MAQLLNMFVCNLSLQGHSVVPLPQQGLASVALGVRPAPLPTASGSSRGGRAAAGGPAPLWAPASSGTSTQQQRSNALLLSSLGMPGAGSNSSSNAAPRQLDVHVDEEFGPSGGWLAATGLASSCTLRSV